MGVIGGAYPERTVPVAYREHAPPPALEAVVACRWEHQPAADHVQRIIPDGCVDLIWLADRELVVAGPDTAARTAMLPAGARSSGIRLRPGAAGAVLGLPASELRDREVALRDVWGPGTNALRDAIAAADPTQRLTLLSAAVAARHATPDPLVAEAALRLGRPGARIATVAADLGVGERRLHRRTQAAVGYAPKVLARVVRLRRLVALGAGEPLAARAFAAGYASQAHMGDEVRRLTGLTPVGFLADAALTAA